MKDFSNLPWGTVDWSLFNKTIAAQLGCSHITVHKYRQRYAPGTNKKCKFEWGRVKDWNQRTDVLAKIVGCSESRVTMYRHERGIPLGPRKPGSGHWKKRTAQVCENSPCKD